MASFNPTIVSFDLQVTVVWSPIPMRMGVHWYGFKSTLTASKFTERVPNMPAYDAHKHTHTLNAISVIVNDAKIDKGMFPVQVWTIVLNRVSGEGSRMDEGLNMRASDFLTFTVIELRSHCHRVKVTENREWVKEGFSRRMWNLMSGYHRGLLTWLC